MSPSRPLSIAIAAMGGQGGGVLAEWLVALAEHNGHFAQSTSVPGVANGRAPLRNWMGKRCRRDTWLS